MSERLALTFAIDRETHDELCKIAARWKVDLDHVVMTALMRLVDDEAPLDASLAGLPPPPATPGLEIFDDAAAALRRFIQEGVDSADRGELVNHDDLMAELARRDDAAVKSKKKHAA